MDDLTTPIMDSYIQFIENIHQYVESKINEGHDDHYMVQINPHSISFGDYDRLYISTHLPMDIIQRLQKASEDSETTLWIYEVSSEDDFPPIRYYRVRLCILLDGIQRSIDSHFYDQRRQKRQLERQQKTQTITITSDGI